MSNQQLVHVAPLTVDEAEQTVYNLDEVLEALHRSANGGAGDIPQELREQCEEVAGQVQSARNKIHKGLVDAGVQLEYLSVN